MNIKLGVINGNSQAVRIPQEFRLNAQRVEITRTEQGDLLIHPLPINKGAALLDTLAGFDDEHEHPVFIGVHGGERAQYRQMTGCSL